MGYMYLTTKKGALRLHPFISGVGLFYSLPSVWYLAISFGVVTPMQADVKLSINYRLY